MFHLVKNKPLVRSAILEYTDNIWLAVNFVFLNCILTTMGRIVKRSNAKKASFTAKTFSETAQATSIICHRSLQITRYEVLYLKTRLIIISFPNILSLWPLFQPCRSLISSLKCLFSTKVLRLVYYDVYVIFEKNSMRNSMCHADSIWYGLCTHEIISMINQCHQWLIDDWKFCGLSIIHR